MGKRKTTKQAPLTKEGTEKKEEKAKKTYALPKHEGKGHAGDIDDIEKVQIPDRLEKELVDLILEAHQCRKCLGVVSKRITAKKLTDIYNSLWNAGFSQRQVEGAMSATVEKGGDLHDALDWLCLNIPNDQLPKGFSQTLQAEEEKKNKPRFDVSQQQDTKGRPPTQAVPAVPIKSQAPETEIEQKETVKDWILHYAEQCSDTESEEEDQYKDEDPNSQYLLLTAQLEDAKAEAAIAKLRGDKAAQQKASKTVQHLNVEIEAVEQHPDFIPETRVAFASSDKKVAIANPKSMQQHTQSISAPTSSTSKTGARLPSPVPTAVGRGAGSSDGEDGDEFSLFGFDNMATAASDVGVSRPKKETVKDDVRQFEYTRQQWTGKHPKQFLIDWCRKHFPNSSPPKYHKIQLKHNRFKCQVTVDRPKDPLVVTPTILCEDAKESEMLASTLALFHLCHGQSVEQLLPPPYRAVWLEWMDAEKAAKLEAQDKENKPRDQFVRNMLKKLKLDDEENTRRHPDASQSEACSSRSSAAGHGSGEGDQFPADDVEDSWETLIDEPPEPEPVSVSAAKPPSRKQKASSSPESKTSSQPTSESLAVALQRLQAGQRHRALLAGRLQLPVSQFRQNVLQLVCSANVVVVAGETGSGKSTQIPQFILEDCILSGKGSSCNIVVTQPRRISAISLANRVSEEIGESPKESRSNLCGYQIRFENRRSSWTRLTYCTTGVLLRQFQSDRSLSSVSHLIIDEVHERSVQSDFLLAIIKSILAQRPDLKVILMSATLDSDKFSSYFSRCPVLNIPGRTFPVEVHHIEDIIEMTGYVVEEDSPYTLKHGQLVEEDWASVEVTEQGGQTAQVNVSWTKEDISSIDRTGLSADRYNKRTRNAVTRLDPNKINMDLIMMLLKHLESAAPYSHVDGACLIFLPGLADIQELNETLTTDHHFSNPKKYRIFALHSVLPSEDQSQVFEVPPPGIKKIVLATNIAETGITIPDVVFIIDSGKVKENRYNETSQMSSLTEVFVSQANAKQRQGRAGRVRDGFCFRLFTADKFRSLPQFTVPEILRVPLEELCLTIMKCELSRPADFLSGCLDPPQPGMVNRAMALLREVGACFADASSLTPLGHHLATLPVHVRIGKMLIYAAILGCLEPIAVIAAAMSDKSPFMVPFNDRDKANAARQELMLAASDHLMLYRAYAGWKQACSQGRSAEIQYCNRYFLKRNTLLDIENIKTELTKLVISIGFGSQKTPGKELSKEKSSVHTVPDVLDISKVISKSNSLDPETVALVKAVLCAGLYSQVARTKPVDSAEASAHPGQQKPCLAETAQGHAQIHPSSFNRFLKLYNAAWFVYGEKVKISTRVYVRDTTVVSAYPLLLFGGDIKVQHLQKLLLIDNWIKYKAVARTGVIFKELRTIFDQLLEKKLAQPDLDIAGDRLIGLITKLLTTEKPIKGH